MAESDLKISSYLQYLPAIFQEEADDSGVSVLGKFLLAFEHVLGQNRMGENEVGDSAEQPSIKEVLDEIHLYFDPTTAPAGNLSDKRKNTLGPHQADFLTWLASWVGLTLRDDWTVEERTRLMGRIIPLYRLRGTKEGLRQLLEIYTGHKRVKIYEFPNSPFYFQVELTFLEKSFENYRAKQFIARAIIDQEKPAHTYYRLQVRSGRTIQIGRTSTIGKDTYLSSQPSINLETNGTELRLVGDAHPTED